MVNLVSSKASLNLLIIILLPTMRERDLRDCKIAFRISGCQHDVKVGTKLGVNPKYLLRNLLYSKCFKANFMHQVNNVNLLEFGNIFSRYCDFYQVYYCKTSVAVIQILFEKIFLFFVRL